MEYEHFIENSDFEERMKEVKKILEDKGFIVESDTYIAYSAQYDSAKRDIQKWLSNNGYEGEIKNIGSYDDEVGSVYGYYDDLVITVEEMKKELKKEIERQKKDAK